jgi:hypothetical protein
MPDAELLETDPAKRAHMRGELNVRRPDGLPQVAMLAGSYGGQSIVRGVFANCTYATRDRELDASMLGALGWAKLPTAERERIGMLWVRGVLLYGDQVIETELHYPNEKEHPPFQRPSATTKDDGTTSITLWYSDELRTVFTLTEFVIAPDGGVRIHEMNGFTVH